MKQKPPVTSLDESDTNPHATRVYWSNMGDTAIGNCEPGPEGELNFDDAAERQESA